MYIKSFPVASENTTVTCCHHFLTFHSHLHPPQSCSCPCNATETALVLACKDLFLLIPRRLTSLQHFTQSFAHLESLLSTGLTTCPLMTVLLFFWSTSYPFSHTFQFPSSHPFLSPLNLFGLLVLLYTFYLNDLCLSWYHFHPYANGSKSRPSPSTALDVCSKYLRDFLKRSTFQGMTLLSNSMLKLYYCVTFPDSTASISRDECFHSSLDHKFMS